MSVKVLSRVFGNFHRDSDLGDRLVLVVLADEAHDDGVSWLSQETIAAKSLLSDRHVRRCLKELEARGEIEIRKAQRKRKRINVYRVTCAPDEPNYERYPFVLTQPWTATGHSVRSPDDNDRTSGTATTGHLQPNTAVAPSIGPVSGPASKPSAAGAAGGAPKLAKVGGRNLVFDAVAEECGVDPRNRRRATEIATAVKEIREYVAGDHTGLAGEEFERLAAVEVVRRASLYRRRMSDATLTPIALAKWWHDVDRDQKPRSLDDIDRL